VASVVNLVWSQVYHTERPSLQHVCSDAACRAGLSVAADTCKKFTVLDSTSLHNSLLSSLYFNKLFIFLCTTDLYLNLIIISLVLWW